MVTGGTGFLGKAVVRLLKRDGYTKVIPLPGSKTWDLTKQNYVVYALQQFKPKVIIHLAARVGGIGANQKNPGKFMYENLSMGLNLIEGARRQNICKKFIMVGTVCAYPKFTPVPFKEEDLWNGYPEETNAPYGIAKKTLMKLVETYHEQYGMNGVNLVPVNMYGPYDHFNLTSSHVIPALILKIHNAIINNEKSITLWGTGQASREFLYAPDCAEAIRLAIEKDVSPDPINIGTGKGLSVIQAISCFEKANDKKINYSIGHRRDGDVEEIYSDNAKVEKLLNWKAEISVETAMTDAWNWELKKMK